MNHEDKEQFLAMIELAMKHSGFHAGLFERDYYTTLIVTHINELSNRLVFRGDTCLTKVYYNHYRLSEHVGFCMRLPFRDITRLVRRGAMRPIKQKIPSFAKRYGMRVEGVENASQEKSQKYVYYFVYPSVVVPPEGVIKCEVGLLANPINRAVLKSVSSICAHPFTGAPLIEARVPCLTHDEVLAEKMRGAALRKEIAPRDFYDLDYVLRQGFQLTRDVMRLFRKKLFEYDADLNLERYRNYFGRTTEEITDMKARMSQELFPVLRPEEKETCNVDEALVRINNALNAVLSK